jgi:hypothetical protein
MPTHPRGAAMAQWNSENKGDIKRSRIPYEGLETILQL